MKILLLRIGESLAGKLIEENESLVIRVGGQQFYGTESDGLVGFHDWIRDAGEVIGVKLRLLDPAALSDVQLPDYATIDESEGSIAVMFNSKSQGVVGDDQAFRYNQFMRTSNGEVCVLVDVSDISKSQLSVIVEKLKDVDAAWG